jgi:hypothetical protein
MVMLQFKVLYAISTQRYCAQQNVGSRHYQAKDVYTVVRFTLYLNHFLSNEKQVIGLYSTPLLKLIMTLITRVTNSSLSGRLFYYK